MPDGLLAAERTSPLPGGERSREARVRGIQTSSATTPSPRPSPHWVEGKGRSLREAFIEAASLFRKVGIETPELDARLLLCHAAGLTHEAYITRAGGKLAADAAARLESFIARRLEREPVSRIIGTREFYGREFLVDRHTLDPRPDTEIPIETALELVAQQGSRNRPRRLLDLGTGTGCILITLLAELPQARGLGTDISATALELAAANARRLGVAERARFVCSDWLGGINGKFELILSNPPYIPSAEIAGLAEEVARHDPRLALDGGADGLDAYRRIAAGAPQALAPNGKVLVEIGAGQAEAVAEIFAKAGLTLDGDTAIRRDLAGRARLVVAGT
jgi:release factor glutamine methyltransferase